MKRYRIIDYGYTALAAMALTMISLMFASTAHAAAFTPGNLVIYRVGSGTGSLVNTGNPVYLDEYTPSGTLIQSIALPTTANGAQKQLIASGTAGSEGFLTRSADGQYLLLTGYATSIPYASSLLTSTASSVPRVIGRVDANGNIDTSTALTDFASANSPRSAVSTDGTTIWVTGGTGVRITTLGAVTSTSISALNSRQLNIFSGQLYLSSSTGTDTNKGVNTVGTGLPTTSGQTVSRLPGLTDVTNPSAYSFFFADLDANVAGFDTLYVADDDVAALQKFSLVSGNWSSNGIIGATTDDYRGLTGAVSGTTVTLYATRKGGTGSTGGGELVAMTDSTGYNGIFTGTPTLLASASISTAFRGVAFVPVPIGTPTPTATGTPVPSVTPTATGTPTPTSTPSSTATNTSIPSATPTATSTSTSTPTVTATNTTVPTATPSNTSIPSATSTATVTDTPVPSTTPTATSTAVPTGTPTASLTATDTAIPTNTPSITPTASATSEPSATATPTLMLTATATSAPTDTAIATVTPTQPVVPTITASPTSTATNTPAATATETGTPSPTTTSVATATSTAQATVTATASDTPTITATPTVLATSTILPTETTLPTVTATQSATASVTPTASDTPTATHTPTPTGTATATVTVTPTPRATVVVSTDQPTTLTYTDTEGAVIAVQLPTGAVSETITLAYTDLGTLPSDPPSGFQFGNQIFDLDAFHDNTLLENFTFQQPVTITLSYNDSDVAGLDEATLTVRYFDPKTNQWQTDGITIVERDLDNNRITFTVTHLTVFGMFGSSGSSFRGYLPLVVR
ncbi:MAG: hypothetical protein U0175_23355 [Caldilineaceae bacterium]